MVAGAVLAPLHGLPAWIAALGLTGAGAIGLRLVQLVLQWRRHEASTGLAIKKHRDGLTLDLLREARAEVAVARSEIKELRDQVEARDAKLSRLGEIEERLKLFDEAIEHIEALLEADIAGGREAAEHSARQFLARHEALKQIRGDQAQAEQVGRAARLGRGRTIDGGKDGK